MAVEIHVLSGSRQGERVELDQREFVVGTDPGSAVQFDPQDDPPAANRSAHFRLTDDGWTLKNLGAGELLLNQQPVAATAHVRSGDIVRLSAEGPDLAFTILARAAQPAAAAAGPTSAPAPLPADEPGQPTPSLSGPAVVLPLAVLGGIVLCLAAVAVGWRMMSARPVAKDNPPAPGANTPAAKPGETPKPADNGKTPTETPKPPVDTGTEKPDVPTVPPKEPPAKPDDTPKPPTTKPNGANWQQVLDDVRPSVFLLEAQHPSGQATWPVANAVAIRDDTLLTTGTAASALAAFQKRGWKLFARNPSLGTQRPIEKLLVHKGYQQMPEKLEAGQKDPRMYFDLALVAVPTKPAELAALPVGSAAEGLAVADVGIPYEAQRVDTLDSSTAEIHTGKVFRIDPLAAEPGSPAILDVTVPIPTPEGKTQGPYLIGSALVDAKKQIVALYSSPPLSPQAENLDIHHFVETGLVKLWLAGKDTDSWVEPIVPDAEKQEPSTEPKPSGNP